MPEVLKLDDARKMTPAVTDVAACVMRLQGAVFDSVSEADVRAIMAKQKEKALAGDQKAAEFVLGYVASPKVNYTRRDTTITHEDKRERRAKPVDGDVIDAAPSALGRFAQREAAKILGSAGATELGDLADELDIAGVDLLPLLAAPWFTKNGRGQFHLTEAGRKELLPQ